MADPVIITTNYVPSAPGLPGSVSAGYVATTPAVPGAVSANYVAGSPVAPVAVPVLLGPRDSMEIVGDAAVAAGYYVGEDTSLNGVYRFAGMDEDGYPRYTVSGTWPIQGVGLEIAIEHSLMGGWSVTAYGDGSYITEWDQGGMGPEETPDQVTSFAYHSGSNGMEPQIVAVPGSLGVPAVLTADHVPGTVSPPAVVTG